MSNEKVLVQDNAELSENQILALGKKRQESGEKLEALRECLRAFIGTPPTYDEVLEYIQLEKERDVKIKAVKKLMELQNANISINLHSAVDAIHAPDEIKNIIEAWKNLEGHKPAQIDKYWSDTKQGFKVLKVTDTEQEGIRERVRYYALPENVELVSLLKNLAILMTISGKAANKNAAMDELTKTGGEFLKSNYENKNPFGLISYQWLAPFIEFDKGFEEKTWRGEKWKVETRPVGFYLNEHALVDAQILIPGEPFQAFDE